MWRNEYSSSPATWLRGSRRIRSRASSVSRRSSRSVMPAGSRRGRLARRSCPITDASRSAARGRRAAGRSVRRSPPGPRSGGHGPRAGPSVIDAASSSMNSGLPAGDVDDLPIAGSVATAQDVRPRSPPRPRRDRTQGDRRLRDRPSAPRPTRRRSLRPGERRNTTGTSRTRVREVFDQLELAGLRPVDVLEPEHRRAASSPNPRRIGAWRRTAGSGRRSAGPRRGRGAARGTG